MRATDATNLSTQVQRTVIVTSMASLAYQPVFAMPTGSQLLAAEGTRVLYDAGSGAMRMRDLATGVEATLAGAPQIQYIRGWNLDAGRAYAMGKGADCVSYCIYQWGADGTRTNLSTPNPYSRAPNVGGGWATDEQPVARDGFVVWVNSGANRCTVFNASSGTYSVVPAPAGVRGVGNTSYDLTATSGVPDFWYWVQTDGEGATLTYDIYRWRADTGVSTRITAGGGRSVYPQTDGARAAWMQLAPGVSTSDPFTLVSVPISGGATTAVSSTATSFLLRGGVLAWAESGAGGARAIKASTGPSTVTLSNLSSSTLLANGGGQVAFVEQGRVYTFDAATGRSTLRVETIPTGTAFITGGALVFTVQGAVYRVWLN